MDDNPDYRLVELVERTGVPRREGYLYFLRGTEVWEVERRKPSGDAQQSVKVAEGHFTLEPGYMYWLSDDGDIVRSFRTPRTLEEVETFRRANLHRANDPTFIARIEEMILEIQSIQEEDEE